MPDFVRAIFIHYSNKNRNFLLYKKKEDLLADGYVCERSPLGNVYYRSDGVIATGDISVNYVTYPWLTCFEVDGLTIKNQTSI